MKAIEFLKQMPWRNKWTWCGTWGWLLVSPSNVAKVSLASTSGSSGFHAFVVEITNTTNGLLIMSEFRFQDFLTRQHGKKGEVGILELPGGEMEWKFDHPPTSMHPIIDSIENYVHIFDEYNRFLNGEE